MCGLSCLFQHTPECLRKRKLAIKKCTCKDDCDAKFGSRHTREGGGEASSSRPGLKQVPCLAIFFGSVVFVTQLSGGLKKTLENAVSDWYIPLSSTNCCMVFYLIRSAGE